MSNQEAEMRERIRGLLEKQYLQGGKAPRHKKKKHSIIDSNFNVANYVKKLSKKKGKKKSHKKVNFIQGSGALAGGRRHSSKRHSKKKRGAGALCGGRKPRRRASKKRGGVLSGGVGETKKSVYRPTERDLQITSTAKGATELDQLRYRVGALPTATVEQVYNSMMEQVSLKETEQEFNLMQQMEDLRDELQRRKIQTDAEKDRMAMSKALYDASKLSANEDARQRLYNARLRVRALQKQFGDINQFRITNRVPSAYTEDGSRVYAAPNLRSLGMPHYYSDPHPPMNLETYPFDASWPPLDADMYNLN